MTEDENKRIASLTSNAVRHSAEEMIKSILAQVDEAEATAVALRQDADRLCMEIRKHTDIFAERVTSYVENCQRVSNMVQSLHAEYDVRQDGPSANEPALIQTLEKQLRSAPDVSH